MLGGQLALQLSERNERQQREAAALQAQRDAQIKAAAERAAQLERNREYVRRGAELDAEAERKMKHKYEQ